MKITDYGITRDGEKASRYLLENSNGMEVDVSDFGAVLLAVRVPDKKGVSTDVLLTYPSLEYFYSNPCEFGAYVGRNGNRIGDAKVVLDGVEYQLEKNNNGNNLHSGENRSYHQFYQATTGESAEGKYVELHRVSPHLEQGFPGNLDQKIRYTLSEENEIIIDYEMVSDMTTVINPTNHSYFNLSGHNSGDILSHELEIYSEGFLLTDKNLLPTGEIASVEGTPLDFRTKKAVGRDIEADYEPLVFAGGYDHNFVFENDGKVKLVARVESPDTGIFMETYTDLCGMQLYTGNFMDHVEGKEGAIYPKRGGLCLETQFYPNACNEPKFPSSVVEAGKTFKSRTIYKFGCNCE